MSRVFLSGLFVVAVASASAQEDRGDVGQVHFVKPKDPGANKITDSGNR